MTKPFPLHTLITLAEERSQQAALILAKLKLSWEEAESRLQLLQGYLEEYQLRLAEQARAGLSVARLRDYYAFMHKLELAIRAQRQEVQHCRQRWEAGQREWQEREREAKAYQTLRQRHIASECKLEKKREQRLQDEFASNRHGRGRDVED